MTELKVKHKNREIRYEEQTDTWVCDDLNISRATLSEAKKAVTAAEGEERRVNVKAYWIKNRWDRNNRSGAMPPIITITSLCEAGRYQSQPSECWIKHGSSRRKEQIEYMVPVSEKDAIHNWAKLNAAANKAQHAADKAEEKLPRYTAKMLEEEAKKT